MNTKKVFFGLLAVAFLAMTAVSSNVIDLEKDQTTSVKKKNVQRWR